MEKTIQVLNRMVGDGQFEHYAIGGAVALLFYAEPVNTYDVDVFCVLPASPGTLVTLAPIYAYLRRCGYQEDKEHILIEGIPVQFIPAYNPLVTEAVNEAWVKSFAGEPVNVVRLEHLLAIMIQTGRPKDRLRALQTLEESKIDNSKLSAILSRYGLEERWILWQASTA